ncbi:helix-turn-helix domain-containing protein [Streptomyces sp. NPDC001194]|uniref:helix-turn-helix domain-containing protein n=1 Tax=Streptomyces sp. NPDC001194 TaxID=3364547 RepID=UPI0036ACADDE
MESLLVEWESVHPYLTTAEVAERYRTAESTVRYWRHVGYGPRGVKVGRRVLYSESELARFDQELLSHDGTRGNWTLGA